MPIDNGNLILSKDEKDKALSEDADLIEFIKPYYGGKELLHSDPRFCLWLVNASPSQLRKHKFLIDRINATREYRLSSNRTNTIKAADKPYLFGEIRQPNTGNMIVLPKVSSEKRQYIPIEYMSSDNIVNGSALMIKNGDLYTFGILNSSVHNAWMRTVAGRLETRYQYSARIVYNNFPFPDASDEEVNKIKNTSNEILRARKEDPTASLAELYAPDNFKMLK